MNRYRYIFGAIALAAAIGLGAYFLTRGTPSPPLPNLSPRSGDATASAEFLNAQKAVGYYQEQMRLKPDVIKNYVQLAQLFLQEARITGNHNEYVPKATYLLEEALKRKPDDFEALITKASLFTTLHRFQEAKELALQAIQDNPHNAFAYGVLVDAYVEMGEYDQAVKTCDKMLSIRPDLRSYARASYLRELHGDIEGAIEAMKLAADAGVSGREDRAWVLYNLGKLYLNTGRLDTAAHIFNGILEERPRYAHALSSLARVKGIRKEYAEAIQLYTQAIDALPEPAFHEALGEVYEAMENAAESERHYDLAEELYQNEKDSGEDNDAEIAKFLASHDRRLPDALTLARGAAERRPSIQAHETLALALFKNALYREAHEAIQKAMRLGTKDASMLYLAGLISEKLGEGTNAKQYVSRALSINPYFSLLHSAEANRIAGETQHPNVASIRQQ